MEIESLFGLPAHPLVVHGAVVLLPLAALGALACLIPKARRSIGPVVAGLALVALLFVGLAQGSGEALEDQVDETELVEEHTEMGETVLPWAIALAVSVVALVALDYLTKPATQDGSDAASPPTWVRPVGLVLAAVITISAIGSTVQVAMVGHSGAKATWEDVEEG